MARHQEGMVLEAGTRLGVYEIVAPIGKGGMGQGMTEDGQKFLFAIIAANAPSSPITILQNWRSTVNSRERAR